ncbi:hypothetical protein LAZ67_1004344 [Cordylochernes scorpioides]|uniref:Uncharacterized protein n=1 Tax=Cordylochernes scorpioides TaxID=51811 RepID=A0ABY6K121_9ARAC|nr:hypothetical protein LAZ67_1004344 [Cordylochernes scorpioides]
MFSEGRDVNDEERAGRPSTSTTDEKINEVEKMILANRRITVREVAEDLNISIGSCHSIFINDLGMRRVAAKFVLKLLNCDQKQHRMNIANEMLDSVRDDPNLLQRVITGDEAGVVHHEFLPQGRTLEATENPVKNGKVHEAANHVENGSRHFLFKSGCCDWSVFEERRHPKTPGYTYHYTIRVTDHLSTHLADNLSVAEGLNNRQLVEVYGEKCMDIKNVRKWCRELNEGRINVHDEQRSGRPSLPESTVARIDEMVRANRRITLEIEDGLNEDCSHFSVHKIVSKTLGYKKVSARMTEAMFVIFIYVVQAMIIMQFDFALTNVPEPRLNDNALSQVQLPLFIVAVVSNEELRSATLGLCPFSARLRAIAGHDNM